VDPLPKVETAWRAGTDGRETGVDASALPKIQMRGGASSHRATWRWKRC
jgi:hypothetical protein